jgi:site-specific recombinase XerD
VVPLYAVAGEALEDYLAARYDCVPEAPLFVSVRGRIQKNMLVRLCRRVSLRLGRKLRPHLFRHAFATMPLNQGVDLRSIQMLLGLESLETTEVYLYVSVRCRGWREAVARMPGVPRRITAPGFSTGAVFVELVRK